MDTHGTGSEPARVEPQLAVACRVTRMLCRLRVLLAVTVFAIGMDTRDAPAAPVATQERALPFAADIQAFVSSDRTNPPAQGAVLFIGSSSIRLWSSLAGDFPKHRVLNRGFGGSEIVDSVRYFEQIVLPYRPRLIVLYAGGNDIHGGKTPEQVLGDFKAFAEKTRLALPRTRLAYISIAPNPARWAEVDRVRAANRLIEDYTRKQPQLTFIDVFPHMLGPDGAPKPDIYREDRLHMNQKGYALWQGLVRPYLDP